MKKTKYLFFILGLVCSITSFNNVFSQSIIDEFFSESSKAIIEEYTQKAKNSLTVKEVDTIVFPGFIQDTFDIDTTQFIFLPIINTHIIYNAFSEIKVSKINELVLSEVLLLSKKSNKIVGSSRFCKSGNISHVFFNSRYGISTLPCRSDNRLSYVQQHCFRKFANHFSKNGYGFYFKVYETGSLYYVKNSNEFPILICN
ncbi:MAG: hypothetical protein EA412_08400 [Chitinophagaceae bacterium]|nr:MAG: hypothetical protein EA412_08400 [Chitinophagaceae bacterium]